MKIYLINKQVREAYKELCAKRKALDDAKANGEIDYIKMLKRDVIKSGRNIRNMAITYWILKNCEPK